MPEGGDAEQPVIVHVNEGAPASTVIVMVTVTVTGVAAWAGDVGKASRMNNNPDTARMTPPLLGCKRPSLLP